VYIRSVQFGNPSSNPSTPTNALIDIGAFSGRSDSFSVPYAPGVRQTSFFIRRATAGSPTTVPFIVNDDCGPWRSFSGGGANAF
jgi:hypothetical protein